MVTDRRSNRCPDKDKKKDSLKDSGCIFDKFVGPRNKRTFAVLGDERGTDDFFNEVLRNKRSCHMSFHEKLIKAHRETIF